LSAFFICFSGLEIGMGGLTQLESNSGVDSIMPRQRASEVRRSQARFLGRMIAGAKPAFHPGFVTPQLAYLLEDVPQGPRWLHELKFDGYRLQAHKEKGGVRIYTRSGHDWTQRFSHIAGEVQRLPAQNIILDGEIISATEAGLASFTALQADLSRGDQSRMVYYVFDLLFLDGFDLRDAPLVERKRVLAAFLWNRRRAALCSASIFGRVKTPW
jgi:bifunctional non-homologous end joining protein LigD